MRRERKVHTSRRRGGGGGGGEEKRRDEGRPRFVHLENVVGSRAAALIEPRLNRPRLISFPFVGRTRHTRHTWASRCASPLWSVLELSKCSAPPRKLASGKHIDARKSSRTHLDTSEAEKKLARGKNTGDRKSSRTHTSTRRKRGKKLASGKNTDARNSSLTHTLARREKQQERSLGKKKKEAQVPQVLPPFVSAVMARLVFTVACDLSLCFSSRRTNTTFITPSLHALSSPCAGLRRSESEGIWWQTASIDPHQPHPQHLQMTEFAQTEFSGCGKRHAERYVSAVLF